MMKVECTWWGRRSVKLTEGSELCNFTMRLKKQIETEMKITNDRPPHIEIFSDDDAKKGCDKIAHFNEVSKLSVDTSNINNYTIIGRAYCLCVGNVGNKQRHITVVFGVSHLDLDKLNKITSHIIGN